MTDHTLIQISHYQKKLEKYVATGEDEKLLYCIHKLKYLPVTVSHLEKTGVGKSINGLRHKNGVIGEKARTLVQKWKLMVSKEEEQQQEEESQTEYEPDITSLQNKYCSKSNTPQAVNEEEYDPSDEGDRLQIQEQDEDEGEQNLTYNPGGHSIENEEENFNGYNPKTSREDYLSIGSQSHIDYNPSVNPSDIHSPEQSKPTSPEMSSLPNGDAHKESHHGDPQRDSHEDKSHKSREESKHKKKKHKSKHDSEEQHQSSEHRKSKHKSSKSKDKKRDREKESNKESNKHSSHSSSSKSKSHPSSHHKNKSLTDTSSPVNSSSQANSCSSSNPSNSLSSSDLKRHRDPEDQPEDPSSKKSKSIEKQKDKKSHKSPKSSKDEHKSSKRKKENVSIEAPSEFEAALMGMDSTPSKKKKKKSKEKEKKEILENESPSCSPSSSKLKELDLGYREQLPDLPSSFELETSAAPQLMTHYKPLPHVPQRSSYKDPLNNMTNEEALNYMFTSKSNKQRRIYAGKASGMFSVPSLMDICMRVLQENIDAIETTGGIPYSILKPVLERATPQQLFSLEDYNPYFLEDTDPLWSAHCRKSFKNKQREDMETWREMFIRSTDENQEKMRSVTESLQKKYITKAIPKRMTQLAYVNTAAKPPKSVARAQARYGTASASAPPVKISSKAAEPQSIASTSNSTANGSSSSSGSSSNVVPKPEKLFPNKPPAVKKPKVAPLMGKARQLMKKVCRR